MDFGEFVG